MAPSRYVAQIKAIDIATGFCAAVLVATLGVIYHAVVISPEPGNEARWFQEVLGRLVAMSAASLVAIVVIVLLRRARRRAQEALEADEAERRYQRASRDLGQGDVG